MKRQRSHKRHRRRDAHRRTRSLTKAVMRWRRVLYRMMTVPLCLFGPMVLWSGSPR